MQRSARTPARVPPVSDPDALRALYTRVHWLNIAALDRSIAESEESLRGSEGPEWANHIIRNCLPQLRARRQEYLRDYDHYAQRADDCSLKAMRRFILRARELHAKEPEFSFLFCETNGAACGESSSEGGGASGA